MREPSRHTHSDAAVLEQLGERLTAVRLSRNQTQAALARQAGVSKRTLERMEAGESAQLTSFIRVLRALDGLDRLDALLPPVRPGPMELLRRGGQVPQRARGPSRGNSGTESSDGTAWSWGERS